MAPRKPTYGITKDIIIDFLMRPDTIGMHAIGRALILLNQRQTIDERQDQSTKYHNGIGFTEADAKRGTSMANFYADRKFLTEKQLAYWRKPNIKGIPKICKYWEQILEEARIKAAARKQAELPYLGKPGVRGPIRENEIVNLNQPEKDTIE